MIIRQWAEFTSDLPDDFIEDEHDIIQYGGKSVAAAIGEHLRALGCEVSEPIYADEHGWELDIVAGKRKLWCQVTQIEKWLITFEQAPVLFDFFKKIRPEYLDMLSRLADALAADPRFHDVRWFAPDEVHTEAPGAERPIEA